MSYAWRKIGRQYGEVDLRGRVEAATPHGLVQMLFDELIGSLRQAELCIRNGDLERKSEKIGRALSILQGLEATLDFEKGAEVADSLAAVYRNARAEILAANRHNEPERARSACAMISEIATAWKSIG